MRFGSIVFLILGLMTGACRESGGVQEAAGPAEGLIERAAALELHTPYQPPPDEGLTQALTLLLEAVPSGI